MQHQMLEPVHEELMLGVVIEACVQRNIEQHEPDPECRTPGKADADVARTARKQHRDGNEHGDEHKRRLPRIKQTNERHGGFDGDGKLRVRTYRPTRRVTC
jgi:hypothetical protein